MFKLLAAPFLFASSVVLAQPSDFTRSTARIVAWNLAGFHQIPRDRVPNFIPALRDLDAEILALVEVNSDWVPAELAAELNDLGVCYQRKLLPQSANQNIAILHKCNVEVSNIVFIPDTDLGNWRLRKALVADVRIGQLDFVLITVHLKAGRQRGDRDQRTRQVALISDYIDQRLATEQDIVVAGDYNMIPGDDDANFEALNGGDNLRFISSEDLEGEFTHIHRNGNPGNLLDGFAVSSGMQEYVGGSLRIFPMHRALSMTLSEFLDQVSDHLPLVASVRITDDDD